ncbi:MAG: hypothetical protein ABI806_05590 [Candidatus Solibacter sp.]
MQLSQLLGAIHGLLLIGLCWRSATRLAEGTIPRLCAAFLLLWANLAYTALALASFTKLDSLTLYITVSLAIAATLEAVLHWITAPDLPKLPTVRATLVGQTSVCAPTSVGAPNATTAFDRILLWILGITLLLAAAASALICLYYVPNNWDSLTYRFSRAFFYLTRGDLLHTGNPLDPRLLYYPFNGALFYLFFAIHKFTAGWFYTATALAWIFSGLGTWYAARCMGASRTGAFIAAWICCLAPNILAQAASTNDEILAAVPILLALAFFLEWLAAPRPRYILLAALGLGLGMGTKLHWAFYFLFTAAAALYILVRASRSSTFRADLLHRIPALLAAFALAAPLAFAFAAANYVSSGKLQDEPFANAVLNRPFRLSLALEKIRINTANIFLSPLPDLPTPVDREESKKIYTAFNQFFMRCCFSDLKETTQRSPEGYLFEGPADPEGAPPSPNEYTVWLGFMPHLLLLAAIPLAIVRNKAALAAVAAFFVWFVTYSISSRYIPTASVYYSFPAVLAFAALGPAWDFTRASRRPVAKLVLGAFLAVFATHILLGVNLLGFGALRNLKFVWSRTPAPEMHPAAPSVAKTIRAARRIYIPYSHWELLYWNFMRFNPAAKYSTGVELRMPSPDTMLLLSVAREGGSDLFPARLPTAAATGVLYIGDAAGEPIYAQGGGVEASHPNQPRYMLLPLWWSTDPAGKVNGMTMRVARGSQNVSCCVGVDPADAIDYRYELRHSTGPSHASHDWSRVGDPDPGVSPNATDTYDTLIVETRHRARPLEIHRTERRIAAHAYDLSKDQSR